MTIGAADTPEERAFPHRPQESHDIIPILVTAHPHRSRPPP
ncbi:MAG: hypothetical protein QG597_2300 [Actinomycetota bacterium]|nr:hypothetical protein [Actinomycetota bacterium]